jgi:predicted AlkP superfamily phosphohydrolase/phosphomutase
MRRFALALLLVAALPASSFAWGFAAHRFVNREAIDELPAPLQALFRANADYVAEHAIDPDLWRGAGRPGEDANHYLDLDAFGSYPFADIPRVEAEHLKRHGAEARAKGRLPWRVAEVYRELVAAFREKDSARVLEQAALLGHYVGDAHVPLHAVVNYDGQLTEQKGIHARWENELYERFEQQIVKQVHVSEVGPSSDPVGLTFAALLESYRESIPALASDKESAGPRDFADTPEDDRYGDAYYTRLFAREGARMEQRLELAASRLAALWHGAWEEAGRPALPAFRFPYVRGSAKLILVTLDGSSAPVLDDAVARGLMPNLASLRARGATARGSLASLPAKTPAAHATLFTGAWCDRNGVAGIEVPVPGASILTARSGFTSEMLSAEPIWVTAARQGLDVSVMSATQVYPFAPFLAEKRFGGNFGWNLTLFDGYQNRQTPQTVLTAKDVRIGPAAGWRGTLPAHRGTPRDFDFSAAGVRIDGLLFDDPSDPVEGFDTLYLATDKSGGSGILLKPRQPEPDTDAFQNLVIRTRDGELGLYFRLFSLTPDASELLLYLAEGGVLRSNRPLAEGAALKATGGFVGNGADDLYKDGLLGAPLWKGGDGTAEGRYLETVRLVERQFERLMDFGIDRTRWQVLVGYLPFPDETLHLWLGFLDATLSGHDAGLAARLRPYLDQSLAISDAFIGRLAARAGPDTLLAVGGDHGMIGANRTVQFNVALAKAGLVALTPEGDVDLLRTSAIYFPGNSGYFLVNRVSRKQGIVRPDDEPAVLARLRATLAAIKDPDTGGPVVTAILDPADRTLEPAIGGATGGDLYVDVAPGYYSSASLNGEVVVARRPSGEHLYGPHRPEMLAGFVVAGPGVAHGVDLGPIRQIDIAPTLSALLGIEPPAQAVGVVLRKALEADVSVP